MYVNIYPSLCTCVHSIDIALKIALVNNIDIVLLVEDLLVGKCYAHHNIKMLLLMVSV